MSILTNLSERARLAINRIPIFSEKDKRLIHVALDSTVDTCNDYTDTQIAGVGGIDNVVEDLTPQLGGDLDFNGNKATTFVSDGIDDNATSEQITIEDTHTNFGGASGGYILGIGHSNAYMWLTGDSGGGTNGARLRLGGSTAAAARSVTFFDGVALALQYDPAGSDTWNFQDKPIVSTGTIRGSNTSPTETLAGVIELATQAEVDAGTDAIRAVTPATLAAKTGVYGDMSTQGGATSQDNIGTTPEILVAWNTNGLSNGTTPDHVNNYITVDVAGVYEVSSGLSFTGTANSTVTMEFYVYDDSGASWGASGFKLVRKIGGSSDVGRGALSALLDLDVSDRVALYVATDGALDDITVTEATFHVSRIS